MIQMTLKQLSKILKYCKLVGEIRFAGISVNSKTLEPNNLFIAWKGESSDGHEFVAEAESKGAAGFVVEHDVDTKLPYLIVPDAVKALGDIASFYRAQFNIPLLAVTGSNGKTTIKNMLGNIFNHHCNQDTAAFLVSESSYNNHVGVPLTLFKLDKNHRYVIAEMGMNHFGEISYLTNMARPDVALINNAFVSHLEGVGGTIEGVAKAKGEIFEGLKDEGIAVLNADSEFYDYWKGLAKDHKQLSFGVDHVADIKATNIRLLNDRSEFVLNCPLGKIDIHLPLLGKHNVMNALAASAVSIAVSVSLENIKKGLETFETTNRRLQIYKLASGATLIDDGYNANLASTIAAIDVFKKMSGQKIMLFGDMKELGPDEKKFHREVGEYAKNVGIDKLFALGDLSKETVEAFGEGAQHFENHEQLFDVLEPLLKKDVVILVKGSNSMNMKWFVDQLVKE